LCFERRTREHILSRIRFTPRRTSQQQRHLAICHGLLGEIVVDDDSVLAIVTEVCELLLESEGM
jgi:hypothetical protein